MSKIEERNIEKIKIYLVKKTKMKIQNKYVFRTIISEFLYFKKNIHGSGMVAKPRRRSGMVAKLKHRTNNCV